MICSCEECHETREVMARRSEATNMLWNWPDLQPPAASGNFPLYSDVEPVQAPMPSKHWTVEQLRDALFELPGDADVLIQPNPGGEELAEFMSGLVARVWKNLEGETVYVVYIEGEE